MDRTRMLVVAAGVAPALMACGSHTMKEARPAFGTTNVTLYDCGLAQIERQAEVDGAVSLEIDVEQAHLDDLLASLVLATDGTVKVRGVQFPGVQNLGQTVASSGFANSLMDGGGSLEMPSDMVGYARALAGTSAIISVKDGMSVEGIVLDAVLPPEMETEVDGEKIVKSQEPVLVVVTGEGSLMWIPMETVTEIAPASELEASSIKKFATALGKANGLSETTLVLETTADSKGKLAASYVRQVPVWRMLYKTRVEEGKVILEAWAVVHNDTPEDWTDVTMTLVAGMPRSYVLSVASPRYTHREVIEAPGGWAEMMPQLGASTPDTLLYTWDIYHAGTMIWGSAGGSGYGYGAGGIGLGSMGTIGYGGGGEASSSLLAVGESAAEETMTAEVEKEISTYTAMATVTLASGATSLVPLLRRELPGQAFTMLSGWEAPASCTRVENATGLVLQPGMASFYIDGRFRGQDDLDRLEPGDVRVLCFGEDQDVAFTRESEAVSAPAALEWKKDALWIHLLRTTTMKYEIENFAGEERDLAIEITHVENGRVVSPTDLLGTDVPTRELHPLSIDARSKSEMTIVVEEGIMSPVVFEVVRLDEMLKPGTLPAEQAAVLQAIRALLVDKEKLDEQAAGKRAEVADNEAAIVWQKDLLAAVPQTDGKSKAVDTILSEIMKAQKRIAALGKEIQDLEERSADLVKKANAVAKKMVSPEKPPTPTAP